MKLLPHITPLVIALLALSCVKYEQRAPVRVSVEDAFRNYLYSLGTVADKFVGDSIWNAEVFAASPYDTNVFPGNVIDAGALQEGVVKTCLDRALRSPGTSIADCLGPCAGAARNAGTASCQSATYIRKGISGVPDMALACCCDTGLFNEMTGNVFADAFGGGPVTMEMLTAIGYTVSFCYDDENGIFRGGCRPEDVRDGLVPGACPCCITAVSYGSRSIRLYAAGGYVTEWSTGEVPVPISFTAKYLSDWTRVTRPTRYTNQTIKQ